MKAMNEQNDISFLHLRVTQRKKAKGRSGPKQHHTITGLFFDHARNKEITYDYSACVNALMDRWQRNLTITGLAKGEFSLHQKHQELGHPIVETRKSKRKRQRDFILGR